MKEGLIHYEACPVCGGSSHQFQFTANDHFVTNAPFEVHYCTQCTNWFTQDAPNEFTIAPYYQSAAYVSHSNTKQGLMNRLYHRIRKTTLQWKKRLVMIHTGKKQGKLLEIGAGTGLYLQVMQEAGWQVEGLEPSDDARIVAATNHGVQLQPTAALSKQIEQSFDAITLWHVLEHVHTLHNYFHEFKRLLKPDGRLVIAIPNPTSFDAEAYGKDWAGWDVPRHLYHFSPNGFRQLAAQHGFEVTTVQPMWMDSFYVSMLSEKVRKRKLSFLIGGLKGCWFNMKALFNREKCCCLIYVCKKID